MKRPRVKAAFPVRFWEIRDEILPRGEYLLKGMQLYDY